MSFVEQNQRLLGALRVGDKIQLTDKNDAFKVRNIVGCDDGHVIVTAASHGHKPVVLDSRTSVPPFAVIAEKPVSPSRVPKHRSSDVDSAFRGPPRFGRRRVEDSKVGPHSQNAGLVRTSSVRRSQSSEVGSSCAAEHVPDAEPDSKAESKVRQVAAGGADAAAAEAEPKARQVAAGGADAAAAEAEPKARQVAAGGADAAAAEAEPKERQVAAGGADAAAAEAEPKERQVAAGGAAEAEPKERQVAAGGAAEAEPKERQVAAGGAAEAEPKERQVVKGVAGKVINGTDADTVSRRHVTEQSKKRMVQTEFGVHEEYELGNAGHVATVDASAPVKDGDVFDAKQPSGSAAEHTEFDRFDGERHPPRADIRRVSMGGNESARKLWRGNILDGSLHSSSTASASLHPTKQQHQQDQPYETQWQSNGNAQSDKKLLSNEAEPPSDGEPLTDEELLSGEEEPLSDDELLSDGEEPLSDDELLSGEEEPLSDDELLSDGEEPLSDDELLSGEEEPLSDDELLSDGEEPLSDDELLSGEEEPLSDDELLSGEEEPLSDDEMLSGEEEPLSDDEMLSGEEEPLSDDQMLSSEEEPLSDDELSSDGERLSGAEEPPSGDERRYDKAPLHANVTRDVANKAKTENMAFDNRRVNDITIGNTVVM